MFKKTSLWLLIGAMTWLLVSTEDNSELKQDIRALMDKLKPKGQEFYNAFVELLDDLEGVHSDEIKANIQKRMTRLQKEVGIIDSEDDDGIAKIVSRVKTTISDIKNDINKGVK